MRSIVLPQLSDGQFRLVVMGGGLVFAFIILTLRFCGQPPLPPKPPRPKKQAPVLKNFASSIAQSRAAYESVIQTDAKRYGVAPVTLKDMGKKLSYRVDSTSYTLRPKRGSKVESGGLRLTVKVKRAQISGRKQLLLRIENLTQENLAYRIDTSREFGTKLCRGREVLAHNATAIAPKEVIIRSECLYGRGWKSLQIHSIETVSLSRLGYYYISGLRPDSIGLDPRPTKGHQASGKVRMCDMNKSAALDGAFRQREVQWIDIIDFFSRHSCHDYRFPLSYRAFATDHERPLPVAQ